MRGRDRWAGLSRAPVAARCGTGINAGCGGPKAAHLGRDSYRGLATTWSNTNSELKSGNDLRVVLDVSVSVNSDGASALRTEIEQVLEDLKSDGRVSVQWE